MAVAVGFALPPLPRLKTLAESGATVAGWSSWERREGRWPVFLDKAALCYARITAWCGKCSLNPPLASQDKSTLPDWGLLGNVRPSSLPQFFTDPILPRRHFRAGVALCPAYPTGEI